MELKSRSSTETVEKLEAALRRFVASSRDERQAMGAEATHNFQTISYGALRKLAGVTIPCNGMGPLLTRIGIASAGEGMGRLDAVVVNARTKLPGAGYFASSSQSAWLDDLKRVFGRR